ncbi:hypothetical protein KCP75_15765 [Salmonella enterica subsp. enterica]|nr:hypothetical protein KCP75_15765 [Salmonella enterica subsp. enterica]
MLDEGNTEKTDRTGTGTLPFCIIRCVLTGEGFPGDTKTPPASRLNASPSGTYHTSLGRMGR